MGRHITLILVVILVFLSTLTVNATYLYDEENSALYIGGFPIERLLRSLGKIESYGLEYKIYILNVGKEVPTLLIETSDAIAEYASGAKSYLGISTTRKDVSKNEFIRKLIIYDLRGQVIKTIQDVPVRSEEKFFSWSSDGFKIAYVTGRSVIEGRVPFEPTGAYVYDIQSAKTEKISETGVKINWSKHDNNIYIQNKFDHDDPEDISVYNVQTGRLSKSDRKGIVFSDDGKYCFGRKAFIDVDGYRGESRFIYDNSSNEIVHQIKEVAKNVSFIDGTHNLLIWGGVDADFKIVDADKRSYIRSTNKYGLLGWNKNMTKLIVYQGGNQVHIDETISGKRLRSLSLPK